MSNYLASLKKNITTLLELKDGQVKFMEDSRSDGSKTSQYQLGIYIDSAEKYASIKSALVEYISKHTECESVNNDTLKCISYSDGDNSGKSSEYSVFFPEDFKENMYYKIGHAVCERLILSRRFLLKSLVVQFLNRLGSIDVKKTSEEESQLYDKKKAEETEIDEQKGREEDRKLKEERERIEEQTRLDEERLMEEQRLAELEAARLAKEAPNSKEAIAAAEKAQLALSAVEAATGARRNIVDAVPPAPVVAAEANKDKDEDEDEEFEDIDAEDPDAIEKITAQNIQIQAEIDKIKNQSGGSYNIHPRYIRKN
jgi:hypothetical protein